MSRWNFIRWHSSSNPHSLQDVPKGLRGQSRPQAFPQAHFASISLFIFGFANFTFCFSFAEVFRYPHLTEPISPPIFLRNAPKWHFFELQESCAFHLPSRSLLFGIQDMKGVRNLGNIYKQHIYISILLWIRWKPYFSHPLFFMLACRHWRRNPTITVYVLPLRLLIVIPLNKNLFLHSLGDVNAPTGRCSLCALYMFSIFASMCSICVVGNLSVACRSSPFAQEALQLQCEWLIEHFAGHTFGVQPLTQRAHTTWCCPLHIACQSGR